ncbi:TetR/AcrR family transcriptional regulator [Saccharothrix syringae]|uniref:TetR/AcrR family transcriptional regulator n=1 Tax=Saccharothrix syringae TaxID=103733 RepID=A0A5Q0GUC0_SACSY|nr:TetR/AcrR family transcriptional regulator [Saccharothrix syringae]QFZ17667.1 TetR/AcrR family transcriptional regulator [Saccharothrix syringae]
MAAKDDVQRRTLELLWKGARRPARGPQQGLTVERIVAAAIDLVEAEGLTALSMRRVAQELGVGPASLYTYLPGKAELEALMLDAVQLGETLPHEWPGDWRAKTEAWARSDWEGFRRHPWLLRLVATTPFPGPNTLRWLDSALRVLEDTGLTEPEKMAVVESVDSYVRGQARLSLEEHAPSPTEASERDALLAELVDFTAYPALTRTIQAGVAPYAADRFEFGLQRLLDGVATLITTRTPPP